MGSEVSKPSTPPGSYSPEMGSGSSNKPSTLYDCLISKNPELDVHTPTGTPANITKWEDFTHDNLLYGWYEFLNMENFGDLPCTDSINKRIVSEEGIDSIAKLWNWEIIMEPLRRASQKFLPSIRGAHSGYITAIDKREMTLKQCSSRPDMAIFWMPPNGSPKFALVVGEHRCATKWNSSTLGLSDMSATDTPLRKILAYCAAANTRYAWIMTTDEVVVLRVSRSQGTYHVEYAAIPWDNHGPGNLTVNLAIWWLGMLSLEGNHRVITDPRNVVATNSWLRQGNGFTNYYTGYLRPNVPPGGVVMEDHTPFRRDKKQRR